MFEYGGICVFGAPHSWMICDEFYLSTGPGVGRGFLGFALAPGAEHVGSWGDRVRVTGHFDDPAAARMVAQWLASEILAIDLDSPGD